MTPYEVLVCEWGSSTPFMSMFGCRELEAAAEYIVEQCLEHGDRWDANLNVHAIPLWLGSHLHFGSDHVCSMDKFIQDNRVTPAFIRRVTRTE